MDYGVEAAEFVDLVGNCSCPSDGGEVARDYPLGAGSRREGVATATLVTSVQKDLVALADQESGRHETETVR